MWLPLTVSLAWLTVPGSTVPSPQIYRGEPEALALFPDVAWLHPALPAEGFPGRYAPVFGVRQAVERLAEKPIELLEEAWRFGRLDVPRLFRWFETQQIEIFADDPTLAGAIRRLPLCPVDGELRPLADLFLPGGFEDPLQLAGAAPDSLSGRLFSPGSVSLFFTRGNGRAGAAGPYC